MDNRLLSLPTQQVPSGIPLGTPNFSLPFTTVASPIDQKYCHDQTVRFLAKGLLTNAEGFALIIDSFFHFDASGLIYLTSVI